MIRPARILLAGTDPGELALEEAVLGAGGHQLRSNHGVLDVTAAIEVFRPDLVILDLGEPAADQIAPVVRRAHASYRPLLLCLLRRRRGARAALVAGADAALVRPFDAEELTIHVAALLRRAPWLAHIVHQVGPLVVDEDSRIVLVDDEPVALAPKELDLLLVLLNHAGTVVSKQALLDHLWGFDTFDENLVEVHVCALRRRLPPAASEMIQTVRGAGYVLRETVPQGRRA